MGRRAAATGKEEGGEGKGLQDGRPCCQAQGEVEAEADSWVLAEGGKWLRREGALGTGSGAVLWACGGFR